MDIKDIKVGETYNVRVKINGYNLAKNACRVWDCGGHPCYFEPEDFTPLSPANGTKNTEPAPKYDPFRLFKKGDIVRVVKYKGRKGSSIVPPGAITTVDTGEEECDWVYINTPDASTTTIDPAYLELVTPVEELEPYYVEEGQMSFRLKKGDKRLANYWRAHPNAKAAAEAERDRLNAEWRKELE